MRYKSLPASVDIDPEVALLQAVRALDAAAETAERINDVEGLLNTAAMWMKLSGSIEIVAEDDPKYVRTTEAKFETGFQRTDIIAEGEENE